MLKSSRLTLVKQPPYISSPSRPRELPSPINMAQLVNLLVEKGQCDPTTTHHGMTKFYFASMVRSHGDT